MTNIITMPFAWIMRLLYSFTQSYGLTLILFTLVVKLVMLPFQIKSKKSMVRMGRLSDKQKELQKKYANNQQKYQEELQKLYQEAGVNPMGGCLWSFLPLFILIPLYSIIRMPLTYFMRLSEDAVTAVRALATSLGYVAEMQGDKLTAYEQIALAEFVNKHWANFEGKFDGLMQVNFDFIGLDLTAVPTAVFKSFAFNWACIGILLIPVISAALSFVQTKITSSSNGSKEMAQQMKTMNIMMPLMSIYIGFILPASLGLYWIANSVFSIIQEATTGKYINNKIQAEEDEAEAKREAARKLRMEEAKRQAEEMKANPEKYAKKKVEKKTEKKNEEKGSTNEAGRVGNRPYARGRSYVENRYE